VFLFFAFLVCRYTVNWCDKLRFCIYNIIAVLSPVSVIGQGSLVNNRGHTHIA